MTDEKNDPFRVVDKRRFGGDGNEKSVEQTVDKTTKPEQRELPPERSGDEAITYSSFVFSIGMQGLVMMGEGELQAPSDGPVEVNLAAARETIDLLSLLKEKTKGNLTHEEEKLTEEILTSLRLTYVKKTK